MPDGLEPLQGELDDDTSWRGVQVSGDVAIHGAPDHVEIEESRCRQIRLTGCELSHLRATDVVFEDCELSGVVLSSATFLRVELSRCRLSGLVAPGLMAKDVRFVEPAEDVSDEIETAYRTKYRRYNASEVDPLFTPDARAATLELVPRSAAS